MSHASKHQTHDRHLDLIKEALAQYDAGHPAAQSEAYRHNPGSIRVRIIDPDLGKHDRVDRESLVWGLFEGLPDGVHAEITLLLLLTPAEAETSLASFEFDNPSPSRL